MCGFPHVPLYLNKMTGEQDADIPETNTMCMGSQSRGRIGRCIWLLVTQPQDKMPGGFVFALFLIVYFRDLFYFMCMGVSPASMFMHHVCSAHRGQKKALGPLGT